MKSLLLVTVLLVCIYISIGEEYCTIGDQRIKKGENKPLPIGKGCGLATCTNPPAYAAVECGTFVPKPGCKISDVDNTKQYPECCAKEICP